MVVIGQSGYIQARVVKFKKSGCIRAKLVVFGQKWFYSAKWLYSGKSVCVRQSC